MRRRMEWRVWTRFYSFGRSVRWQIEYELVGQPEYATWAVPSWAGAGANIIGDWQAVKRRLTWFHVPVSPWQRVSGARTL